MAMRSCYPELVCKGSIKSNAVHVIEDAFVETRLMRMTSSPEADFSDVELLLSEHQLQLDSKDLSEASVKMMWLKFLP